jgi:glycosyltransferase 2 family protein
VPKGRTATRVLRVVFLVAVAAGAGVALYRLWPKVSASLAQVSWPGLCLSALLALGFQLTGMFAWRRTLDELGSRLPAASAAHIYLVSQLGKYVPGSVWAGVAMVRLGREAAVPASRMAFSYLLATAFSLLTGLTIGVPALIVYGSYLPLALATLGVLGVILLWPRALNAILNLGLKLARRGRLERPLSGRGIVRIVGLYLVTWIVGGLHVWALSVAVGGKALPSLFPSIAAFTVASALGVLVVLAPAGAGVRDVLMVLILTPVTGAAAATAAAVLSRGLLTLLDLAGGGIASFAWRPTPDPEARQADPRPTGSAG